MMKKENEFDNILDECLERVIGGEPVERCLSDYPQYAADLEPLLRTALDAKMATAIEPRPEFRNRARYQFQNAIRDMETPRPRGFFSWQPRWVTAVIVVAVLLIAGSGTVLASGDSLPDEPLYQVKLTTEAVRLAFTPSAVGKAELYVELADKRVEEIIRMADEGKVEQVEQVTERLNDQLIAVANLDLPGGGVSLERETGTFEAAAPQADEGEAPQMQAREAAPPPAAEAAPAVVPVPKAVPAPTPAPVIVEEAPQAPLKQEPPTAAAEKAPMVAIEKAPAATAPVEPGVSNGAGPVSDNAVINEGIKPDEQTKLRTVLSRKAVENSQALQDILNRVPESVRPALLRAIEVADNGYDKALKNLQ
jgi:hypothetical protein